MSSTRYGSLHKHHAKGACMRTWWWTIHQREHDPKDSNLERKNGTIPGQTSCKSGLHKNPVYHTWFTGGDTAPFCHFGCQPPNLRTCGPPSTGPGLRAGTWNGGSTATQTESSHSIISSSIISFLNIIISILNIIISIVNIITGIISHQHHHKH